MSSEWGASASIKTLAVSGFESDWDKYVRRGTDLLEKDKLALTA
jgi:hypothetical protein